MDTTVNERFVMLLKALRMNQTQLAHTLNVTPSSISLIVNGSTLSMEMLDKLSETHNVSKAWMVEGIGSMFKGGVDVASSTKNTSDAWAQKTVDQMQERINALEADKKYLQDLLQMAVTGKGNFLKGNLHVFPLHGGHVTQKAAA